MFKSYSLTDESYSFVGEYGTLNEAIESLNGLAGIVEKNEGVGVVIVAVVTGP